jgi:hypothetical protein
VGARARLTRLERAGRLRRLDDVVERMSDEERAEAARLTRKWPASPASLTADEAERLAARDRRLVGDEPPAAP